MYVVYRPAGGYLPPVECTTSLMKAFDIVLIKFPTGGICWFRFWGWGVDEGNTVRIVVRYCCEKCSGSVA